MAQRTIGTKLAIDGEREYKQALSEVNSSLGVLKAEMKKTSAEFKGSADSMEAMRAKGDLLERTLLTQKEKVDTLREALKNAAQEYGESDKRTMAWQKSLYEAEAAVAETENAIRENTEAMEQSNEVMEDSSQKTMGLGSAIDQLTGKLGISLPDGIKNSLDGLGQLSGGAVAAVAAVAAAITAVKKIESELMQITQEAAARADEIATESVISGLSTETVQQLRYSAELLDVSYSTVSGSMSKLLTNMDKARDGNEAMRKSFAELGVSIENSVTGELRSAEDVFYDVIDALGDVQNQTERDAMAMDIFGKSAQELNPLIKSGSQALKDLGAEAEAAGYIMSSDMIDSLVGVSDAYERLQNQQEAVKNQLANAFAPAQQEVFNDMRSLIKVCGEELVRSGLVESFGSILVSLTDMIGPLMTLVNSVLPLVQVVLSPIAGLLAVISDTLNVIFGALTLNGNQIKTALGLNAQYGQFSATQVWNGTAAKYRDTSSGYRYDPSTGLYTGNYFNAAGDIDFNGGLTRVGENGPETVYLPRGSRIMNAQESRLEDSVNVYNITVENISDVETLMQIIRELKAQRRKR